MAKKGLSVVLELPLEFSVALAKSKQNLVAWMKHDGNKYVF